MEGISYSGTKPNRQIFAYGQLIATENATGYTSTNSYVKVGDYIKAYTNSFTSSLLNKDETYLVEDIKRVTEGYSLFNRGPTPETERWRKEVDVRFALRPLSGGPRIMVSSNVALFYVIPKEIVEGASLLSSMQANEQGRETLRNQLMIQELLRQQSLRQG
jgi:hypothetical protein